MLFSPAPLSRRRALTEPAVPAELRRRRATLWSLAALAGGIALSALFAHEHARLLHGQELDERERAVERVAGGLREQLETAAVLIRALQALYVPPDAISPARFEEMHARLQPRSSFPGLIATGFSRRVVEPGGRVRYPTERVAPLAGNEAVLGLDVASQPANLRALEASRDSNQPSLSESFRLVQRAALDGPVDGVTLRLPVYADGAVPATVIERRERLTGSLVMSFRVSQLIAQALPQDGIDPYHVRVLDVTQGLAKPLFASRTPPAQDARWQQRELLFGGRTWRIDLAPAAGAATGTAWIPRFTFVGGVLASLLLTLWLRAVGLTRERALRLADRLSAQHRDSEARLRALNEVLPTAVVLARAGSGRIVQVNRAGRELLGLDDDRSDAQDAQVPRRAGSPGAADAQDAQVPRRAGSPGAADAQDAQVPRRAGSPGAADAPLLAQLFEDAGLGSLVSGSGSEPLPGALVTRLVSAGRGTFWASVALERVELDTGPHVLAVISDVTEFRELTDRLGYQASHDAITDLFNRREFERRLDIAARGEDGRRGGALLYLDLDQFKLINDTSGHLAGDQLLASLGTVLKAQLQPGDVLARLGGDEFGILLDVATPEAALERAEALRQAVDDFSFAWESKRYALTVSIGIVMLDLRAGRGLRELLSLADTACYMAKERGRNRIHRFSEHDLETTQRRSEMEWASRLRQALAENRFTLHYQEIQPLRPGRAAGAHFELLLRLRDEQGALVPPGAFVPAAERFHLMPQLDRWVLQRALAGFDRLHPQGTPGLCSINLSGNTLEDESFPEFVVEQLRRHRVPANRICFEITETAAVGNMARVVHFIQRLRALGCRFALDDFGVGMSSFGYLKNLPVDFIKIDGSFIRELETDAMSYSIVRAVTDIGHQVGVEVVAEFVGNERTRELLRGLGVDYAQGYAVHRPVPAGSAAALEDVPA
jgi:diguanylate cyclase (GGDEF)-like protein